MKKVIFIWLMIIFLPAIFLVLRSFWGLLGQLAYAGYYFPLGELGEPFFMHVENMNWYLPTLYGQIITAVIYSAVFWTIFLIIKKAKIDIFWKKIVLNNPIAIKVIEKTILLTLSLYVPILQFLPSLIAFPLFLLPEINKPMEVIFIYFYPKSFLTVIIFIIYYLLVVYIYEFIKSTYNKNEERNTNPLAD